MVQPGPSAVGPRQSFHSGRVLVVILAVSLLLALPLPFFPTPHDAEAISPPFEANVRVDDSPAEVDSARIATAAGVLHAAWRDRRNGNWDVYYSRSLDRGTSWSPSVRVDDTPGADDVWEMDLAVNQSGNEVYVAWTDPRGGDTDLFARASNNGGLSWSAGVRVDTAPAGIEALRPAIAVDMAGTVHVLWEDWRNATAPWQVFHSRSGTEGATWSANMQVSAAPATRMATAVALAAMGGGELHAVWRESGTGPEAILSANSLDGGASWSLAQVTPSSGTTPVFTPDVTAVTGTIYATWISQGQVRIVRSSRSVDGGATWSAPVRADDVPTAFADAFPEDPKVAVVLGNPYIVWDDIRSTLRDLYVSGSSDGGTTWGDCPAPCWPNNDIRVDDSVVADTQRHPDTASSAAGLYAVWEDDRTGSTDIYFARHVISDVLVTELRDGPDAAEEVVEIAVYSETPVDFAGWDLVVDGTWYPLGGLGVVPGWELRTVGNWPSADLVLGGFAVGDVYGNEGGTIQVRDDIGALEDEIRYGQLGRAPDPIPGASTSRRIVGLAYSNEWTLDVTPTFGTPNDSGRVLAQPAVILNEILYDATVPGTRFIEVRLRGGAPLNTTGYRVVGDAVFTIPAASGETLTPANPEGQVVNAAAPFLFASLGPPGDNLYLYDPAWNLLDEVGWSTAHPVDTSVCRVPDGAGTFASFNDPTAVTARWQFGCAPSPPQIGLAPSPQVGRGDRGDVVRFSLTVTNKQAVPDSIDLAAATAPNGWLVEFYDAADATPLADGPDPGTDPETSLLGVDEAEDITVRVTVPAGIPAQDSESITVTATASASAASESASLRVDLNPYLVVDRWADPTTISDLGTGLNDQTSITLELRGRGTTIPSAVTDQADLVFVVDDSGSMATWLPEFQQQIDGIVSRLQENITDLQLGLVSYEDIPFIELDCDLTSDMVGFKVSVNARMPPWVAQEQGGEIPGPRNPEDPDAALEIAANVTWRAPSALGTPTRIMVLLGDREGRDNAHLLQVAQWARQTMGIRTNAISVGDAITSSWFSQTAAAGEGWFEEVTASARLTDALVEGIMRFVPPVSRAGGDLDPTDSDPMVRDVLPPFIVVDAATFVDPVTLSPRPPSYMGTDASGNTVLEWNVSTVRTDTVWSVEFQVGSTRTGLVPTNVFGSSRARYSDWNNATVTIPFPEVWITVVPGLLPPGRVTTVWDGGTWFSLSWEAPVTVPDHYLIYRASGSPRAFTQLDPMTAYSVVYPPATTWIDPQPLGVAGERFYVMRSSNPLGSNLGPTSNTAGVFIGTLNRGLTAISRPLEYFPWVDYSGAELDTLSEHAAAFGASSIEYLDASGTWQTGSSQTLAVGEAYLIRHPTGGPFVFTGLPGSQIRYDEGPPSGFTLAEARTLTAAVAGDDITLSWTTPAAAASLASLEVWHGTTRTGIFDGSASPLVSLPAAATTFTHAGALLGGDEHYYWIVPRDLSGELVASTYSIGVWAKTFVAHDTLALPLRPDVAREVSWYADGVPGALGSLWLTANGAWVPHFTAMAAGVYDAPVASGSGVQISIRSAAPVRYAFVGG